MYIPKHPLFIQWLNEKYNPSLRDAKAKWRVAMHKANIIRQKLNALNEVLEIEVKKLEAIRIEIENKK